MNPDRIIGIDPGVTGALAWLKDGRADHIVDMPANPQDLRDILAESAGYGWSVVIEQAGARPGQGLASTFKIGYGFGVLVGMMAGLGIPYRAVTPVVWKRQMGLGGKDKEASRALARSLWPHAELARKKDHGRAEALLLAEWARRQEVGPRAR